MMTIDSGLFFGATLY